MDRQHAGTRFWTTFVEDREDGFAGLRLHRERRPGGESSVAAEVIFWDAAGQFFVRTFGGGEVPLAVLEALIAEARDAVKTA